MGMPTRVVKPVRTFLSLGAGVQSTALLLLLQHGVFDIEPPERAIFADTGWEPEYVYEHLEQLIGISEIPISVVKTEYYGSLRDNLVHAKKGYLKIPAYYRHEDDRIGMLNRECTEAWKIRPTNKEIRRCIGMQRIGRLNPICLYLGISFDELQRMKQNKNKHITNTYPLVDQKWTRQDCLNWLADNYPQLNPRKSACIGCPFHSNTEWMRLDDAQRQDAIDADYELRQYGPYYLHRSGKPLDKVYDELDDIKDSSLFGDELIADECGGYCMI